VLIHLLPYFVCFLQSVSYCYTMFQFSFLKLWHFRKCHEHNGGQVRWHFSSFVLSPLSPEPACVLPLCVVLSSWGQQFRGQGVPLNRNPITITYCGKKKYLKHVRPRVIDSPVTLVKVTLVTRPLLTQKLCRYDDGVFTSRTCVRSRTLLRIEIVCCCSWRI
jgi:hypothetical protein